MAFADGSMSVFGCHAPDPRRYDGGDKTYFGVAQDAFTALSLVRLIERLQYTHVCMVDATYGSVRCFCEDGMYDIETIKTLLQTAIEKDAREERDEQAAWEDQRDAYELADKCSNDEEAI